MRDCGMGLFGLMKGKPANATTPPVPVVRLGGGAEWREVAYMRAQ